MDGLGQAVGNGISGLVGGAISSISAALEGMVDALERSLPPGALPVIGVAAVLLVMLAILRR